MKITDKDMRQIRRIILFTAILILAIMNIKLILNWIGIGIGFLFPFVLGGIVAFILNIPMNFFEKKIFSEKAIKKHPKLSKIRRATGLILAIISFIVVMAVVILVVVPQVGYAFVEIGKQIPIYSEKLVTEAENLLKAYPQIATEIGDLSSLELNWNSIGSSVLNFLKSGMTTALFSTISIASSVLSGVVNAFIAIVFAIYILTQKEKLAKQGKLVIVAYLPENHAEKVLRILQITHQTFTNFITGQCMEAVILGMLFVISMTIFQFPYPLVVGILIAFTALIPIVGAFLGCAVGAFLILMTAPDKVLWFLLLFLIIQQIEGNLIYPHVVGGSVGLPSMWVLAAVSIGGSAMGVVGMLIFIPILSVVYRLFKEDVYKKIEVKKVAVKTFEAPTEDESPGIKETKE